MKPLTKPQIKVGVFPTRFPGRHTRSCCSTIEVVRGALQCYSNQSNFIFLWGSYLCFPLPFQSIIKCYWFFLLNISWAIFQLLPIHRSGSGHTICLLDYYSSQKVFFVPPALLYSAKFLILQQESCHQNTNLIMLFPCIKAFNRFKMSTE